MKEAEELVATATDTGSAAVTGRDRQREQTRRRVRESALTIFRRDGLSAARIDDIVRAARVSRGTFYFHFPTKEDVIVEMLGESQHRIAAAIAKLPRATRIERVLEVTCEKIAEEWEAEPRLFQEVGAVAVRRAAASLREGQRDPVSQALADGFRAAVARKELTEFLPAEILADFFLVNAFAAALSWCAHPKTPLRTVFSSVIGIFLNGARAQRRASSPRRRSRAASEPELSRLAQVGGAPMGMSSSIARGGLGALTLGSRSAARRTSRRRAPSPPTTLGRVLYGVVCDRVGAQSLPTDVTGASFQSICHPDASGAYATTVDISQLPPLDDPAYTPSGQLIPLAQQQASRTYEIARVEALGRDRESIVAALDAAFPDTQIPVLPPPPAPAPAPCDPPPTSAQVSLQTDLGATLGRLLDLYDDADQTLPSVTRAVGRTLNDIKSDPDTQAALARLNARQGYRPIPIALGTIRPLLSYPRLVELTRSVVAPLLSEVGQPEGAAALAYDALSSVGYQELRTPGDPSPTIPLTVTPDPMLPGRSVLSRPRTSLEAIRDVVSLVSPDFAAGTPDYLVQRDARGYAAVPLLNGAVPAPFVDLTGPSGAPDGLPDLDALGQFITSTGLPPTSPFFAPGEQDGARDVNGRALLGAGNASLLYGYVDAYQTALAALARDSQTFFVPGVATNKETAMNALAALPVLAGTRDAQPVTMKVYPPDPYAVENWEVGHTGPPPAGLGTTPVSLSYRAFHPDSSPVADLVYALGQVAAAPEMDDFLALAQQLFTSHPNDLANLMGLALEIHKIAANHPEATLPAQETFWDDVFVKLAPVVHEPGLMEDILRGFADPATLPMEQVLETFFAMKDDVSYDTNNLNGSAIDLDTGVSPPDFVVPVDRTQPDVGANRSELQKFLQLLHDTNGLSICTKDGAIVHISNLPLPAPLNGISFNYPADTSTATAPNLISAAMCGVFGSTAPAHLDRCAVFGYQNVMSLLLDVLLGKALLQVNDPCLNTLMNSSFVRGLGDGSQYGGANLFLQAISGVEGFSLQPDLRGFARLLYFETPYPGLPTDPNATLSKLLDGGALNGGGALTSNFLADTIDPIPSMVCNETPYTTPDGTVFPLRTCSSIGDVLRARDPDALFPVDELGFVSSLQPLASAFDKHNQPLLFANLFDVLHTHWGSNKQPPTVCDPTLPRTNARWCSQDGLVTYEPLLGEVLKNGAFARLQGFLNSAATITVNHCTAFDPQSHRCTSSVPYDGIHVVAQALELLLDPQRMPGLVDRTGSPFAQRNDGQKTDALTGMDLLVQGFTAMDKSFATYASLHPGDTSRHAMWLAARSSFVDTFLTVNGQGAQASFANRTLIDVVPQAIGALREQVAANCSPGTSCTWAQQGLVNNLSETLGGPSFAAAIDLLDALRQDKAARPELEQLVSYLLDAASGNDAQAGVFASALDLLQVLEDDTNLPPFEKVLGRTIAPPVTDASGNVVQRSLADAGMRALTQIFALDQQGTGTSACSSQRDPNRALGVLLAKLVTPMASDELAPLDVLMSAIADVNRADPSSTTKLNGADYGNIANEMSQFCLDSTRGLEQFYAVIHQITGG